MNLRSPGGSVYDQTDAGNGSFQDYRQRDRTLCALEGRNSAGDPDCSQATSPHLTSSLRRGDTDTTGDIFMRIAGEDTQVQHSYEGDRQSDNPGSDVSNHLLHASYYNPFILDCRVLGWLSCLVHTNVFLFLITPACPVPCSDSSHPGSGISLHKGIGRAHSRQTPVRPHTSRTDDDAISSNENKQGLTRLIVSNRPYGFPTSTVLGCRAFSSENPSTSNRTSPIGPEGNKSPEADGR